MGGYVHVKEEAGEGEEANTIMVIASVNYWVLIANLCGPCGVGNLRGQTL